MVRFMRLAAIGLLAVLPLGCSKAAAEKLRFATAAYHPGYLGAITPALPKLSADETAKVRKLIDELGGDFKTRERASKELNKFSAGALPLLQEAAKNTSNPEVKRRLEEIMPAMERAAALGPTRVTLSLKDKSIRDAVQELSKASGYTIQLQNDGRPNEGTRKVTVEFKDTPFWEALDKLCEAGEVRIAENYYGGQMPILMLQSGAATSFTSNDGPFRINVRGFYYSKNIDFTGQSGGRVDGGVARNESLQVHIGVHTEMKIPITSLGQPQITEAVDDAEESMAVVAGNPNDRSYYPGGYGGGGFQFMQQTQTNLLPTRNGKKLKTLKGTVPITVIGAQRPKITIDKLTEVKNQTFKDGAITLTIDSVTKNGPGQFSMQVSISNNTGGQPDYNWGYQVVNRMAITDAKGGRYQVYQNNWNNNGNNCNGTLTITNNGQNNLGDPVKLVFYEWTMMTHTVPFEFKNVPLPSSF